MHYLFFGWSIYRGDTPKCTTKGIWYQTDTSLNSKVLIGTKESSESKQRSILTFKPCDSMQPAALSIRLKAVAAF